MSGGTGLRDEIRELLRAYGPLTSGELYERSELCTKREQTYMAVHDLKRAGELFTTPDKRHCLSDPGQSKGREAPPSAGFPIQPGSAAPSSCEVFRALLAVLLDACTESPDPGIRGLAAALREYREDT